MAALIDIHRAKVETVPAAFERVLALLDDLPATMDHFPSLRLFKPLGNDAYHWHLDPLGPGKYRVSIDFGTRFTLDRAAGIVRFEPVANLGTAQVKGQIQIRPKGEDASDIAMNVTGKVKVPIPMLLKALAAPIVAREFGHLVDGFVGNLKRSYL